MQSLFALAIGVLLVCAPARGQISFVEVANASGIVGGDLAQGWGNGLAAADFDDDGDVDLFLPTESGSAHQLFRNLGDGQFEEIAATVGLASVEGARSALWLDYDGDGDLDLVTGNDCFHTTCAGGDLYLHLFRQGEDGAFVDVTTQAGLLDQNRTKDEHRSGIAAGDVNGDGFLDLVTGYWEGTFHLYLSGTDGTFTDISVSSGLGSAVVGHWQPVVLDFDDDGKLDIYSSVDFSENLLFMNQGAPGGEPLFVEMAATAGCDNAMNDMGVAVGDYDGDGDPDLYVTNILRDDRHNVLLRNDSTDQTPGCVELSQEAGVRDGGWGWGTTFVDLDNDGDLDLAETNGWQLNGWEVPMRLFVHQGDAPPTFVDQAAAAGLTDTSWGSSLLGLDYDRDGDLDLIQTLARGAMGGSQRTGQEARATAGSVMLFQNQLAATPEAEHYLVVRPRMAGPNSRAIGARVLAEVKERTMTRWITAGVSFLGQEPAEAYFGLGEAMSVDRVVVRWPDGTTQETLDVAADQVVTVTDLRLFEDGFEAGDALGWGNVVP